MNFYRYEARGSNGALLKGTVQAMSPEDVQRDLVGKGFTLVTIEALGGNSGPAVPGGHLNAPILAQPVAPAVRPQTVPLQRNPVLNSPPAGVSPRAASPVAAAQGLQVFRTKMGTDKQRFFIFSQLASAFRSGLNAGDAFGQIAQRSAEQFGESLRYASSAVMEGRAISDVLAQFPDLYPPDVVGLTRAGEAAGFLPDAFEEIARQAESAHAFRRWFFWIWFVVVNTVLSIPLMWVTNDAIMRDWNKQNATGGSGADLFLKEMWNSFLWPWGPITLVMYAILWGLRQWFLSRGSRDFRHQLGLKAPVYGKRALQENLARFSWTMARVSKAGMSPARSWTLAAESVPNLAFRQQIEQVGTALSGQEKMSDLIFRSKLFPDEYAPMIATAEYTGDYSGALDKLAVVSAGEFMVAQNYAKVRSGCWGVLFLFAVGSFLIGSILYTVDNKIPRQIMDETDRGE